MASEKFAITRTFETDGVDVSLFARAPHGPRDPDWVPPLYRYPHSAPDGYHPNFGLQLAVEIKPVVGDDYPAVLRQMRANGSTVLFVGEYRGQGATEDQFIKTFATAGIRVVFARDVEG
jgi:hypothetical protein